MRPTKLPPERASAGIFPNNASPSTAVNEQNDESDDPLALVQGVTVQLTLGVVKNIIPAIASTNAIVAAACTLEALKLVTMCSTGLDNYMMCAPPLASCSLSRTDCPTWAQAPKAPLMPILY